MTWLNVLIVLFISSTFYQASSYIVNHNLSYHFLNQLDRLPLSPITIFWTSNLAMLLLTMTMNMRHHSSHSRSFSAPFFLQKFA